MVTDEEFAKREAEVAALLREAGICVPPKDPSKSDAGRVDRIVEQALFEAVVRDTAEFAFRSFGETLSGVFSALSRSATPPPIKPPSAPNPPPNDWDESSGA